MSCVPFTAGDADLFKKEWSVSKRTAIRHTLTLAEGLVNNDDSLSLTRAAYAAAGVPPTDRRYTDYEMRHALYAVACGTRREGLSQADATKQYGVGTRTLGKYLAGLRATLQVQNLAAVEPADIRKAVDGIAFQNQGGHQ
jgi:hypothetical protein